MSNAIRFIFPYKKRGVWMFDDEGVGLREEPFVAGMPEIIDDFVAGIKDAGNGFALYFSDHPFPGHQIKLDWQRAEQGGNWYRLAEREGWLCPAMFKYFALAPSSLYCRAEAGSSQSTSPK